MAQNQHFIMALDNGVPLRVEYSLSNSGRAVIPILQSMCEWVLENAASDITDNTSMCVTCPHAKLNCE